MRGRAGLQRRRKPRRRRGGGSTCPPRARCTACTHRPREACCGSHLGRWRREGQQRRHRTCLGHRRDTSARRNTGRRRAAPLWRTSSEEGASGSYQCPGTPRFCPCSSTRTCHSRSCNPFPPGTSGSCARSSWHRSPDHTCSGAVMQISTRGSASRCCMLCRLIEPSGPDSCPACSRCSCADRCGHCQAPGKFRPDTPVPASSHQSPARRPDSNVLAGRVRSPEKKPSST
mmetsp:Transcript_27451/g.60055  ORF Transcript_27451/g.60055 Transcript_27451/m.60055 type:complete len:230 (-) Transcript_27451:2558-3247(-)